jgi:cytochrome c-type biogenesis protein
LWKTIGQNYDGPALRGVRFPLAALVVEPSLGLIACFKRRFVAVERVIGVPMVLTGVTFIIGGAQKPSGWLRQTFPDLWTGL